MIGAARGSRVVAARSRAAILAASWEDKKKRCHTRECQVSPAQARSRHNTARHGVMHIHSSRMASQLLHLPKHTHNGLPTRACTTSRHVKNETVPDHRLTQYPTRGSCKPAVNNTAGYATPGLTLSTGEYALMVS